jgi:hypothetical protein
MQRSSARTARTETAARLNLSNEKLPALSGASLARGKKNAQKITLFQRFVASLQQECDS